jgi:hypothetical protein
VHILDDHSEDRDVKKMTAMLQKHSSRHKFIPLSTTGNGQSMEANFKYAKENNFELIYFCEDDYLHIPQAIPVMLSFYNTYLKENNRDCIIHPSDYIDRYTRDKPYPSLIFLGEDRHWRTIRHTTGTFMISRRVLVSYWKTYLTFADYNKRKKGGEKKTVNKIYRREVCVSPIPSLTAHVSPNPPLPPYVDWETLFNHIKSEI